MKSAHPDQWVPKTKTKKALPDSMIPPRRKYTRRAVRQTPRIPSIVAHYCPQCGLNLEVLNAAITVANHHNS